MDDSDFNVLNEISVILVIGYNSKNSKSAQSFHAAAFCDVITTIIWFRFCIYMFARKQYSIWELQVEDSFVFF